jgi:hypothetical protein
MRLQSITLPRPASPRVPALRVRRRRWRFTRSLQFLATRSPRSLGPRTRRHAQPLRFALESGRPARSRRASPPGDQTRDLTRGPGFDRDGMLILMSRRCRMRNMDRIVARRIVPLRNLCHPRQRRLGRVSSRACIRRRGGRTNIPQRRANLRRRSPDRTRRSEQRRSVQHARHAAGIRQPLHDAISERTRATYSARRLRGRARISPSLQPYLEASTCTWS